MPEPAPQPAPAAGGFPIAVGVLAGAVIGLAAGQPTIGVLIGGAGGAAVALAMWLHGRG